MGCCSSGNYEENYDYEAALAADTHRYGRVLGKPNLGGKNEAELKEADDQSDIAKYVNADFKDGGPIYVHSERHVEEHGLLDCFEYGDLKAHTIWECFQMGVERHPNRPLFGTRRFSGPNHAQTGAFVWQTYQQIDVAVRKVASGLLGMGLKPGDTVGICSANRAEWMITALACYSQKLVVVALYDTLGEDAVEYILNHAEVSVAFCSKAKLPLLIDCVDKVGTLKKIVMFDHFEPYDNTNEVVDEGDQKHADDHKVELLGLHSGLMKLASQKDAFPEPPQGEDLAMIMYTSGSTGAPKGVLLSHRNIVCTAGAAVNAAIPLRETDVLLSYLPLAHIFETVVQCALLGVGAAIGFFGANIKLLSQDIADLRPTVFAGVPRVFSRIHDKVMATINAKPGCVRGMIMNQMKSRKQAAREGRRFEMGDAFFMQKICAKMGLDRCRVIVSGAAPLASYLKEFLLAVVNPTLGVLEGYGLSETAAAVTLATTQDNTLGHVGAPLPSALVRLQSVPEMGYYADKGTGEVCIAGPCVCQGYYKNPDKTAETMEGPWFHTGDIGRFNDNGTLSIIDRKKNIFKLAQGEYVAAEKVEAVYKRSDMIGQVWVYGNSFKSFLVAVVVPNGEYWWTAAKKRGWWPKESDAAALSSAEWRAAFKKAIDEHYDQVQGEIHADIKRLSQEHKLKGYEVVRGLILETDLDELLQGFNVERETLTPTFKLRRPFLLKYYHEKMVESYTALGEPQKPGEKW